MDPIKVCITGAAGQIGYSLIPHVASGYVFGKEQHIILSLLDITPMMSVLEGVAMEIKDCTFPLIDEVICTDIASTAFKGADAVFLVGAMPRKQGMERKDLLSANVKIFKDQGEALEKVAKKTVKLLVVGNPANTNAAICSKFAPSIPKENFSCLTRLDQNRAQAQIADRLGVPITAVKKVIIWGNHSNTQFPDVRYATVKKDGAEMSVMDALKDEEYVKGDFVKTVQQRGAAVIKARGLSSAMSAAKASADHMKDWWCGTDEWVSMGVFSKHFSPLVPADVVFSVPVTIDEKSNWTIPDSVEFDTFAQEKIRVTAQELVEEKELAQNVTSS